MTRGRKPTPIADRIAAAITIADNGCWLWPHLRTDGYGAMWVGSRSDGTRRAARSHIMSYETFVGPVPEGLHLDHLCRTPACCNPAHLEPVSPRENILRSPIAEAALCAQKTHCLHGHEFTPENTYMNKGKRYCYACRREITSRRRCERGTREALDRKA